MTTPPRPGGSDEIADRFAEEDRKRMEYLNRASSQRYDRESTRCECGKPKRKQSKRCIWCRVDER